MVLRKNVVVLVYAPNNCYTRVVPLAEAEEVTVNCQDGLWFDGGGTIRQIGEHRNCGLDSVREGVIGVYDRSLIEQLNSMLHAAEYATRQPPCMADMAEGD